MDAAKARRLVQALSASNGDGKNGVLGDMDVLKELRNIIQKEPDCIRVLADEGILKILVNKLEIAPDSNQVFLLQILASLGYVVQKSGERKDAAIQFGAFGAIVNRLMKSCTSEGVILLGVQVITFLVDDSEEKLRQFAKCNGVEMCLKILQRGCVRSSLLNARVATLLSRIADLVPNESTNICMRILNVIRASVDQMAERLQRGQTTADASNAVSSMNQTMMLSPPSPGRGGPSSNGNSNGNTRTSPIPLSIQTTRTHHHHHHNDNNGEDIKSSPLKALDDTCITLTQGLGLLLDGKPWSTKACFEAGFGETFMKLLSLHHQISSHLIETVCWTMTYAVACDPERAKSIVVDYPNGNGPKIIARLVRHNVRLEDTFIQAFASLVSHLIEGLVITSRKSNNANPLESAATNLIREIMDNMLLIEQVKSPRRKQNENNPDTVLAMHSAGNSLRAFRRIAKLGGYTLELVLNMDALQIYTTLLRLCKSYPSCFKAEILQEVGLLVENSPKLGLYLAEKGACEQLKGIVDMCKNAQELCNATRALACFVEHGGPIGNQITDIALRDKCDESLVRILCCKKESPLVDHEVLLNTVGAFGYMVKRQSIFSKNLDDASAATSSLSSLNGVLLGGVQKLHGQASGGLIALLKRNDIGESLTWNALWALIYLMNGSNGETCSRTVYNEGGLELLTNIVQSSVHNQPLVCSAAKAIYYLTQYCPEESIAAIPLDVRLKVLACATRSRPMNSTTNEAEFGTLELSIDPGHIAESSAKVLQHLKGDQLRGNGLKIQYVSQQVEQLGIDAGGVRRDWLSRLSAELFDPKFSLVISGYHPDDSVQISPMPSFGGLSEEDQGKWYKVLGQVLGLSILYGDPLGIALVPSLCKLLLEESPEFEDVKYVSKSYYTTFSRLKELRELNHQRFEESLADLTFTVNSRECMMKEAMERNQPVVKKQTDPNADAEALGAKHVDAASSDEEEEDDDEDIPAPPPIEQRQKDNVCVDDENECSKIKSLSEIRRALQKAGQRQDRSLIRRLLQRQNEILREKSHQHHQQEEDDHTEDDGSLPGSMQRKRRLSVTSTTSEHENSIKRLRKGAIKMQRMMSDLMDGGDMEKIDAENFDHYLELLTFKLLVENVAAQVAMIKQGFHEVIPKDIIIGLISPEEFASLVEGDRNVNVQVWKRHTEYNGAQENDQVINWFWEYVESLDRTQRQNLLLWSTGWKSLSIGSSGFASKNFTIELTNVNSEADNQRLPSVATCSFNLFLPRYKSKEQLVDRFTVALNEQSFGNC